MRTRTPAPKEKRKKKLPRKVTLTPKEEAQCLLLEVEVYFDHHWKLWRAKKKFNGAHEDFFKRLHLDDPYLMEKSQIRCSVPRFKTVRQVIAACIEPEKYGCSWRN